MRLLLNHNSIFREHGFTLIELLVTTATIAVLAATSMQFYAEFRKRSFDTKAVSDLRNVASAEDAYFASNEIYKSCSSASNCEISLAGIPKLSSEVLLAVTATTTGFVGTASHPKGSGVVYTWNSRHGGM